MSTTLPEDTTAPRRTKRWAALLPVDGAAYPLLLRRAGYRWWRSTAGALAGLVALPFVLAMINQGVVALAWAGTAADQDYADYTARAYAFELPSGMLAANLGIIALAPISWLLVAGVHRVRPRWLSSVQPKIRWPFLLVSLLVALVALVGVVLLSLPVRPLPAWSPQPGFLSFLAVIIFTSPLQAMAEEIFFRGYLLQALGSLLARPWFGVVASAVVFAALHGGQNAALFVDRLLLGLLAGILVWRTGGLEAAMAAHVINNVYTYLVAGLTTSVAAARAVQVTSWTDAALDVAGLAVFAAAALWVARRMRVRTRVDLAMGR